MRRSLVYVLAGLVLGIGASVLWSIFRPNQSIAPTVSNSLNQNANTPIANTNEAAPPVDTAAFSTADLPDRDPRFSFSAELPVGWAAEYIPGSKAINFYDPFANGVTGLDQSQIFVTLFEASDFLTLSTVNITSETSSTINGRPAVTYVIEKKSGVPNFTDQPAWRNQEHRVTDIRSSDRQPAVFFVFAKAPGLATEVFETFLQSVNFTIPVSRAGRDEAN